MQRELKLLGLTNKEIKVYLALLSVGRSPVSVLSYRTDIPRNACRYICQQLIAKKLISAKKEGQSFLYEAESPEKFQYLIDEEKRQIKEKESAFNNVLGDLKSIMSPDTVIPRMKTFKGQEGIISIYEDMVQVGEDIFTWTDISKIYDTLGDYMYEFINKRVDAGITTHAIMPKTQMALQHDNSKEKRKVKFVGSLPIDGELRIYGEKIAIITLHKDEPIGFILESALIAKTLRLIFKNEWREF